MKRNYKIILKVITFFFLFFLLSFPVSWILKDDSNSYARAMFHEFYRQKNIDYLICGASHVSHGLHPEIASSYFGKNVFNCGTPSQKIDGTYSILRQALRLYKIEKVFLELDFAITCEGNFSDRDGFKAEYIVADGLRDFDIKKDYLLNCSKTKFYFNHILPIGKDKLLTLNPSKVIKKIKSLLSGDYFKYRYGDEDSQYGSRGCVLDVECIPKGGFYNDHKESPINVDRISRDWENTIDKIIDLCRQNNIELIFYSMPGSDFYLNERGNYDEYYLYCKNFCAQRGYVYYDFNLAHPDILSLSDMDYSDDNHLCKKGVYNWTEAFCSFFDRKYKEENVLSKYFYSSYLKKMADMEAKVFGLYLILSDDKKFLEIIPVKNKLTPQEIKYSITEISDGREVVIQDKSSDTKIDLSKIGAEKVELRIESFANDILQTSCEESYLIF